MSDNRIASKPKPGSLAELEAIITAAQPAPESDVPIEKPDPWAHFKPTFPPRINCAGGARGRRQHRRRDAVKKAAA